MRRGRRMPDPQRPRPAADGLTRPLAFAGVGFSAIEHAASTPLGVPVPRQVRDAGAIRVFAGTPMFRGNGLVITSEP